MSYQFFLDDVMIPVPPPSMTVRINNCNKTIELIKEGEVNIIRDAGLTEISFDIRLPGNYRPYADYNTTIGSSALQFVAGKLLGQNSAGELFYKGAKTYLEKLRTLKTSKKPFDFIVLRTGANYRTMFDTCLTVTLEEYSIDEDATEGFDVTVPVRLKQYVEYGTKELEETTDENGNKTYRVKQTRKSNKSIANAVKVKREKSLWEICKKASGGSIDWRQTAAYGAMSSPMAVPVPGTTLNLNSI